jgi:hypothetical protein
VHLLQLCSYYVVSPVHREDDFTDSYIGTPISSAYCSAACKATLAPLCVRVGTDVVAAAVGAISKGPNRECIQLNSDDVKGKDVEALL